MVIFQEREGKKIVVHGRPLEKKHNSKNPYNENIDELRDLIRSGLSKSELSALSFSQYIIERHYDLTIARMKKMNIDKEILTQEIREKIYNGESANDLRRQGYQENIIHKHYYKVLRMKTQEIKNGIATR